MPERGDPEAGTVALAVYSYNGSGRMVVEDFQKPDVRRDYFLRQLALPQSVKHWSLRTLREKLIKIGAKVVTHSRYIIFQMAEVAVPKQLFRAILERIRRLRLPEMVPG